MTPYDRRVERARILRVREAIALLEKNPAYPSAIVQIGDKSKQLGDSISEEAKCFGSQARMEYLVKMFDISAQAFLRLVSDLETQKAFTALLDDCFRQAWERYIGYPFDNVPPIGDAARPIEQRVRYWALEGLRRLDTSRRVPEPSNPEPSMESPDERKEPAQDPRFHSAHTAVHTVVFPTPRPARAARLPSTVTSHIAVRRMEAYMSQKGIGQTEFAIQAGTTDRTLRTFRKTGKVRRDIFDGIAKAMGVTKEDLLKSD
jgi:hypothetical protein